METQPDLSAVRNRLLAGHSPDQQGLTLMWLMDSWDYGPAQPCIIGTFGGVACVVSSDDGVNYELWTRAPDGSRKIMLSNILDVEGSYP